MVGTGRAAEFGILISTGEPGRDVGSDSVLMPWSVPGPGDR